MGKGSRSDLHEGSLVLLPASIAAAADGNDEDQGAEEEQYHAPCYSRRDDHIEEREGAGGRYGGECGGFHRRT